MRTLLLLLPLLLLALPSGARADDRIVVFDVEPSPGADALRVELAERGADVVVTPVPTDVDAAARAAIAGGASAVVWRVTGDTVRVHVLRADGSTHEAPLLTDDARGFAIVAGSLLREPSTARPLPPVPVVQAHDAERLRAPTSRAPSGLDPLYLALGLRVAFGPIFTQRQSSGGVLEAEARVGVSFGDFGVALVVRAGAAMLALPTDEVATAGAYFSGSAFLAFLGTARAPGPFSRGALFGIGGGVVFDKPTAGVTLHHPLIWLSESLYLGADVSAQWEPFGSCDDHVGCIGPLLHLQMGLSLVGQS